MKTEVDQISLFQGKKFIGRLDYNVSKLLMQLKEYYNWNFSVEIEKIKRTTTHNIIFITIKRDYSFKCYEVKDVGIFNKIKSFLLGKLEYNSFTKKMLAEFFRNDKNLIIENDFTDSNSVKLNRKNKNLSSVIKYILTVGMFYKTKLDKKSQIVVTEENEKIFATPLFKDYFDINNNVEDVREYPFTVFYDFIPENICFIEKEENYLKTNSVENSFLENENENKNKNENINSENEDENKNKDKDKNKNIKDMENIDENQEEFEIKEEVKKIEYKKVEKIEYKIGKNKNIKVKEKFCVILNDNEFLERLDFSK